MSLKQADHSPSLSGTAHDSSDQLTAIERSPGLVENHHDFNKRSPNSRSTCNCQVGSEEAPAQSDFFALPAELRNRIYDLCIDPGKSFDVHWSNRKGLSPLTEVNRQMRQETISYYKSYQTLKLCSCMSLGNRLDVFLEGPGRTIVPHACSFDLIFNRVGVNIEKLKPGEDVEVAWSYAWSRNGIEDQTDEENDNRFAKLVALEKDIYSILAKTLKVTKSNDYEYIMPVETLKKIHEMSFDFDEKAFGCGRA